MEEDVVTATTGSTGITARYDIESFTFYNRIQVVKELLPESFREDDGDEGKGRHRRDDDAAPSSSSSSSSSTTTLVKVNHDRDHIEYVPAVTVQIQYATTSRGGSIVSLHHDTTGIFIWPATYLLCQYLLLEYTNILGSSNVINDSHSDRDRKSTRLNSVT